MREYDPTQVTLDWNDVDLKEGLSPGPSIAESFNVARATMKPPGPAGHITRVLSGDDSRTITVTLEQESRAHRLLQDIMAAFRTSPPPVYDLVMHNHATGRRTVWRNAWVSAQPGEQYGSDTSSVTWTFIAERADYIGGVSDAEV